MELKRLRNVRLKDTMKKLKSCLEDMLKLCESEILPEERAVEEVRILLLECRSIYEEEYEETWNLMQNFLRLTSGNPKYKDALEQEQSRVRDLIALADTAEKRRAVLDEKSDQITAYRYFTELTVKGLAGAADEIIDFLEEKLSPNLMYGLYRGIYRMTVEESVPSVPEVKNIPEEESVPESARKVCYAELLTDKETEISSDILAGDLKKHMALASFLCLISENGIMTAEQLQAYGQIFLSTGEKVKKMPGMFRAGNRLIPGNGESDRILRDCFEEAGELLDTMLKKGYLVKLFCWQGEQKREFYGISKMSNQLLRKGSPLNRIRQISAFPHSTAMIWPDWRNCVNEQAWDILRLTDFYLAFIMYLKKEKKVNVSHQISEFRRGVTSCSFLLWRGGSVERIWFYTNVEIALKQSVKNQNAKKEVIRTVVSADTFEESVACAEKLAGFERFGIFILDGPEYREYCREEEGKSFLIKGTAVSAEETAAAGEAAAETVEEEVAAETVEEEAAAETVEKKAAVAETVEEKAAVAENGEEETAMAVSVERTGRAQKQIPEQEAQDPGMLMEKSEWKKDHSVSGGYAEKLLKSGNPLCEPEQVFRLTEQLLAEERFSEAAVLAQTFAEAGADLRYELFYKRIQYALDPVHDRPKYLGDTFTELFAVELAYPPAEIDNRFFMMISALLRALHCPEKAYDYSLLSHADQIVRGENEVFRQYPAVKRVISGFRAFLEMEPAGFTESTMEYFQNDSDRQRRTEELKSRAADILCEKQTSNIKMRQVKQMLVECFAPGGDFERCLKMIKEDDTESISFVEAFYGQFAGEDGLTEEEGIDRYIDAQWDKITPVYFKKSMPLEHEGRSKITKRIVERLDLMEKWIRLHRNGRKPHKEPDIAEMKRIRRNLIDSLKEAVRKRGESSKNTGYEAGRKVFLSTLKELCENLEQTEEAGHRWDYISFLQTNEVELTPEGIPVLDPYMNQVTGYEPWRRVLRHIAGVKYTLRESLERIFRDEKEENRDDFGSAALIQEYLYKQEGRQGESLELVIDAADENRKGYVRRFRSDFELAYMYGRIDEREKEVTVRLSEEKAGEFLKYQDFGFYMRFMNALRDRIAVSAKKKKKELSHRYSQLAAGRGYQEYPIRRQIEQLLGSQNLALAEESINLFAGGEKEALEEERKTSDYHALFLEAYEELYGRCMIQKGIQVRTRTYVELEIGRLKKKHPDYTSRDIDSAERLLRNWPGRKDEEGNNAVVKELFLQLGFDVTDCKYNEPRTIGRSGVSMTLSVIPVEKNLSYYRHPIAEYGTRMGKKLHVIGMFGNIATNELIQTISSKNMNLGSNTVVLLDGILSIAERRKIAETFKAETSWQNSFLLIDRVLLMFLLEYRKEERQEVLLKCTLPYTYYQPYNKDGGAIADEMFFGRKTELQSILDRNGAHLVYGGRQLGKTALLQRAESMANHPEEKEYAVFINAQFMKSGELAQKAAAELRFAGILTSEPGNWQELCRELREAHKKETFVRLLLLIDEVDEFLEDIRGNGYSELKLLKELEDSVGQDFKFVMAGLHNISRLEHATDSNSFIPQLRAPLLVKPLAPRDAADLLEIPLLYLGYHFESPEQLSMILLKTNYYPGLLHYFCCTLVETVSENYRKFYSAAKNPPYILNDENLKLIMSENEMNERIKQKFFLTLNLDQRYLKIAYIMAYLYYDKNDGYNSSGYTAEEIMEIGELYVDSLKDLSGNGYAALMTEMEELGVFSVLSGKETRYIFRKYDFFQMFGNMDDVCRELEN